MVGRAISMDRTITLRKPGNTPIVELSGTFGIAHLYMKDETTNPTHTFKDRLAFEMLRPMAESLNRDETVERTTFGSISYGNTALSMGFFCDQLNSLCGREVVSAVAFVPPKLSEKKFGPNTEGRVIKAKAVLGKIAETCEIVDIDLSAKAYREKDLEGLARKYDKVLDRFVDITEGLDRPAYVDIIIEAIEQLKSAPDFVIVPFGAGILCNEIMDYIDDNRLDTKVVPVSSGNPDTIAVMLYGPIWVDTEALARDGKGWTRHDAVDRKGRPRKPYLVYHVDDAEILKAMAVLKDRGITAEASGASGFALLPRLKEIDPTFDPLESSVLVVNTGNGLLNFG